MAAPTLREKVEEKLSVERAEAEEAFYVRILDRVSACIDQGWMGHTLHITVAREDIEHPTYSKQKLSKTYVQLAKEACVHLGGEARLKGYKFSVRGDGIGRDDCFGHPVDLMIKAVEDE